MTAPDPFDDFPFVKWIMNGEDQGNTQPLSRSISEHTEVIAVYETEWIFKPGWNLISTPLDLDNVAFTRLNERLRPPFWKWTGKNLRLQTN